MQEVSERLEREEAGRLKAEAKIADLERLAWALTRHTCHSAAGEGQANALADIEARAFLATEEGQDALQTMLDEDDVTFSPAEPKTTDSPPSPAKPAP